jgi:exosome complex RNA-binding protein Rrp4
VHRVNKLVSVLPVKARYSGQIGDVIVGRILDVGQKRWRVDINATQVPEIRICILIRDRFEKIRGWLILNQGRSITP